MTESTHTPRYFVISGFPKSGNKWLQKMVFDFEEIGCYANDPGEGLPLMCRMFLENEKLMAVLRREGVSVRDFAVRLFDPNSAANLELSERGVAELAICLRDLGLESAKIAPGADPHTRFAHVLDPGHRPPYADRAWKAIGLPGMHTPVAELQSLFPDFSVIHLKRDPRDVTVSFFYHFLATLNPSLALTFVRVNRATGEVENDPQWKRAFGKRIARRLKAYYGKSPLRPSQVHDVCYEDLLSQPVDAMEGVLSFLGVSVPRPTIERIVKDRSFESATGGTQEQRNSMIRKGQAGDWRNYLDRELLEALGKDFIELVRELGYEDDDQWAREVPQAAPKQFDFARFRIRRSTARCFVGYWDRSPELQQRYPDSWQDIEGDDCFYTWLERHGGQDVQDWLNLARRLETLWQVDIVEKAGR